MITTPDDDYAIIILKKAVADLFNIAYDKNLFGAGAEHIKQVNLKYAVFG